jgi:hypothetical protein
MQETPRSLPAALLRHAAADPEAPFLFWAEGWNWRWWPWRQVAALAARWAEPLAGLPAAAAVGFAGDAYPHAIAIDLAIQAAGLTAVPAGAERGESRREALAASGCRAWLEVSPGGEARVERLDVSAGGVGASAESEAALAPGSAGGGGDHDAAAAGIRDAAGAGDRDAVVAGVRGAAGGGLGGASGGVLVRAGGGGSWRRLAPADLLAAAAAIEGAVAETRTLLGVGLPAGSREIVVAGRPLGEEAARRIAAWATVTGAALVLESDASRRLGAAVWARPTVFCGSSGEVVALRRHIEAARGRAPLRLWPLRRRSAGYRKPPGAPRPPLGRLRTLFQDQEPAAAEAAFWQARGARLLRLPGLEAAETHTA